MQFSSQSDIGRSRSASSRSIADHHRSDGDAMAAFYAEVDQFSNQRDINIEIDRIEIIACDGDKIISTTIPGATPCFCILLICEIGGIGENIFIVVDSEVTSYKFIRSDDWGTLYLSDRSDGMIVKGEAQFSYNHRSQIVSAIDDYMNEMNR